MKTFTYSTLHVPPKDVLAISSLLSLFERRLTAKWVMRNHPPGQRVDVHVIDVDRQENGEASPEAPEARIQVAVSENDRLTAEWLVTRPIRAYGTNGVVVLFNSVAEKLESVGPEKSPSRPAMVALPRPPAPIVSPDVTAPAAVRLAPPVPRPDPAPLPASAPAPAAPQPSTLATPTTTQTVQARAPVEKKFGPVEPLVVPALVDMRAVLRASQATPEERPKVVAPAEPITAPQARPEPADRTIVFARGPASPPIVSKWRAPDPIVLPQLIDMRTGRTVGSRPAAQPPAPSEHDAIRVPPEEIIAPVRPLEAILPETPAPAAPPAETPVPSPVVIPVVATVEAPAAAPDAPLELEPEPPSTTVSLPIEEPPGPPDPVLAATLPASAAVVQPTVNDEDLPLEDPSADWWGAPIPAAEPAPAMAVGADESDLSQLLKDLRKSETVGILEIGGLPPICLFPGKRVYFTAAPAARLEAAIAARTKAAFRPCASEDEARRLSGTEGSRPSNLDRLLWAAALLSSSPLPSALAEGPLRLKGWPPVTSSSGNGCYLRYATLLSGGSVTAQQLAGLTGTGLKEVTRFLQASNELGLLERGDGQKRVVMAPAGNDGRANILRSILAQLAPPKI